MFADKLASVAAGLAAVRGTRDGISVPHPGRYFYLRGGRENVLARYPAAAHPANPRTKWLTRMRKREKGRKRKLLNGGGGYGGGGGGFSVPTPGVICTPRRGVDI